MTDVDVYYGDAPTRVGTAHFTRSRGSVSTTFLYDESYLASGAVNIDPSLQLVAGSQYASRLFGAFADTAPDRWGRNLIDKAARLAALEEGRRPGTLDDVDYLLGVSDDTRQGALRFTFAGGDAFLGAKAHVPKLIALPALLRRSDELANDEDYSAAVKELLDTGTTGLGGARPKASVLLEDGSLAIAKFPHSSDEWDVMAWEGVTLELLKDAGINTPWSRLTRLGDRSVLLLRRFDRGPAGERIGYISAMTALGAADGDHRDYVDIADIIRDITASVKVAHAELFDRAVASAALGNTDDHLRNHGFLSDGRYWKLSPVFDVNPTPDPGRARSTTIAGADTIDNEVDGLFALADACDLTSEQARTRIARVASAIAPWAERAARAGIPASQIGLMRHGIGPRLEAVTKAGTAD